MYDKITLKLLSLQIVELYLYKIDETGTGTAITQTINRRKHWSKLGLSDSWAERESWRGQYNCFLYLVSDFNRRICEFERFIFFSKLNNFRSANENRRTI